MYLLYSHSYWVKYQFHLIGFYLPHPYYPVPNLDRQSVVIRVQFSFDIVFHHLVKVSSRIFQNLSSHVCPGYFALDVPSDDCQNRMRHSRFWFCSFCTLRRLVLVLVGVACYDNSWFCQYSIEHVSPRFAFSVHGIRGTTYYDAGELMVIYTWPIDLELNQLHVCSLHCNLSNHKCTASSELENNMLRGNSDEF